MSPEPESERARTVGVACALPQELGGLAERAHARHPRQGSELCELELHGWRVLCCVSGVGKVQAARAATLLLAEGASRLLVVGTCGGLRDSLPPGTLVHCTRAVQVDLSVRGGRESLADPLLRQAWLAVAPGPEGAFLTADRPVLSPWRRYRLARAYPGPCVAEMETAAAAAVAASAGVPWAALRAVTDLADPFRRGGFRKHFPEQAARAADSLGALLELLSRDGRAPVDCHSPPTS